MKNFIKKMLSNTPFALSLSKGVFKHLMLHNLFRTWFDKLTTNGINQCFLKHALHLVLCGLCMVGGAQLYAEELSDPTRPPTSIFAPADASGNVKNSATGLQSILISKQRRAAIIDGVTVELGGKHGDSRLIEVNEGNVVLSGTHGRRVLTLFPDVQVIKKVTER